MGVREDFMNLRPPGGFRVILADPPWSFANWSEKGEEKNPSAHYDTMAAVAIQALPVAALAAKDCALFLWCCWPTMPLWFPTLDAWGFEYKGLAWEWIKFNPATGKYAFGPGYGTRKNLEPCLLAARGSPSLRKGFAGGLFDNGDAAEGVHAVRDFIQWWPGEALRERRREHSRKPDEQYRRIETLFDGPYVELFARNTRPGWSSWGNQVGKFDEVAP